MRTLTALTAILVMLSTFVTGARAQVFVSRAPTAAVLEIQVQTPSAYSPAVSKAATEAVMAELAQKYRFTVTPRKETEQMIVDLGLHLPLGLRYTELLGYKLSVDRVVSGTITEITFMEKPRRACVKLSLSIADVIAGNLAASNASTGCSPSTATGTDTDAALVELAVKEAVRSGLQSIGGLSYPIATITKMDYGSGTALLNIGSRDGLHLNDKGTVVRGGECIAAAYVIWLDPMSARAMFIEGSGPTRAGDQMIF